MEYQNKSNQG